MSGLDLIPPSRVLPRFLETAKQDEAGFASGTAASAINRVVVVRLFTPEPYPLARMVFVNGATIAGTFDVGIYEYGTGVVNRLARSGATSQSGANADQAYTVATIIPAGEFFAAYVVSDGTATIFRTAPVTTWTPTGRALFYIANADANLPATLDVSTPVAHSIFPYIRLER